MRNLFPLRSLVIPLHQEFSDWWQNVINTSVILAISLLNKEQQVLGLRVFNTQQFLEFNKFCLHYFQLYVYFLLMASDTLYLWWLFPVIFKNYINNYMDIKKYKEDKYTENMQIWPKFWRCKNEWHLRNTTLNHLVKK